MQKKVSGKREVLITCGAGLFGGHTVVDLTNSELELVFADNLSTGLRTRIPLTQSRDLIHFIYVVRVNNIAPITKNQGIFNISTGQEYIINTLAKSALQCRPEFTLTEGIRQVWEDDQKGYSI